jgi:hypothetical protein
MLESYEGRGRYRLHSRQAGIGLDLLELRLDGALGSSEAGGASAADAR